MDLSGIRSGIQTRLKTITALAKRAHALWPDQITCPAALVKPLALEFSQSFAQATLVTFEVILLAAPAQAGFERGQTALDDYLDETGASSIKAAIEGDLTLGGTVDWVHVARWRDYGIVDVNGVEYWGVTFDVEVGT